MSPLDYAVLFGTLLAIAIYGWWKTRSDHDLAHYLQGDSSIRWGTIGLSVMATQASAGEGEVSRVVERAVRPIGNEPGVFVVRMGRDVEDAAEDV